MLVTPAPVQTGAGADSGPSLDTHCPTITPDTPIRVLRSRTIITGAASLTRPPVEAQVPICTSSNPADINLEVSVSDDDDHAQGADPAPAPAPALASDIQAGPDSKSSLDAMSIVSPSDGREDDETLPNPGLSSQLSADQHVPPRTLSPSPSPVPSQSPSAFSPPPPSSHDRSTPSPSRSSKPAFQPTSAVHSTSTYRATPGAMGRVPSADPHLLSPHLPSPPFPHVFDNLRSSRPAAVASYSSIHHSLGVGYDETRRDSVQYYRPVQSHCREGEGSGGIPWASLGNRNGVCAGAGDTASEGGWTVKVEDREDERPISAYGESCPRSGRVGRDRTGFDDRDPNDADGGDRYGRATSRRRKREETFTADIDEVEGGEGEERRYRKVMRSRHWRQDLSSLMSPPGDDSFPPRQHLYRLKADDEAEGQDQLGHAEQADLELGLRDGYRHEPQVSATGSIRRYSDSYTRRVDRRGESYHDHKVKSEHERDESHAHVKDQPHPSYVYPYHQDQRPNEEVPDRYHDDDDRYQQGVNRRDIQHRRYPCAPGSDGWSDHSEYSIGGDGNHLHHDVHEADGVDLNLNLMGREQKSSRYGPIRHYYHANPDRAVQDQRHPHVEYRFRPFPVARHRHLKADPRISDPYTPYHPAHIPQAHINREGPRDLGYSFPRRTDRTPRYCSPIGDDLPATLKVDDAERTGTQAAQMQKREEEYGVIGAGAGARGLRNPRMRDEGAKVQPQRAVIMERSGMTRGWTQLGRVEKAGIDGEDGALRAAAGHGIGVGLGLGRQWATPLGPAPSLLHHHFRSASPRGGPTPDGHPPSYLPRHLNPYPGTSHGARGAFKPGPANKPDGPPIPVPPRIKGSRKRVDESQRVILTQAFERSAYPPTAEREALGRELGMTSRSVQIWFQNRRRAIKVEQQSQAQQVERGESSSKL